MSLEIHSELQKQVKDTQSRVQDLELQLVLKESKVLAVKESAERLRTDMEKKVQAAQEAET